MVEEKDFVKKETKFEHSPTQRPFKNHSFEPLYFSESIHKINIAHGIMLKEQGLLSKNEANLIIQGLISINEDKPYMEFEFDGTFEDLFFLVEQELVKRIGSEVAGKLHTGRSPNDMEHTMFRIQLRTRLIGILKQYNSLLGDLIS